MTTPRRARRAERTTLKRWGAVLVWVGIAVVLLGFGACGVSCVGTAVSIGTGISGDTQGAMSTKDLADSVGIISMAMMVG